MEPVTFDTWNGSRAMGLFLKRFYAHKVLCLKANVVWQVRASDFRIFYGISWKFINIELHMCTSVSKSFPKRMMPP